jgi:hypothetical protein
MIGAVFRPLLGALALRSFAERERRRQRLIKLLADVSRRRSSPRRPLPLPR